jgi:hypothetical protein
MWRRTNFFHYHKQYSKLVYVVPGQNLGEDLRPIEVKRIMIDKAESKVL